MGKSLQVGLVHELWRYPVKSMLGEKLDTATVTERGVQGDRALALIDIETGHVVSAKNPLRWPSMFAFQARLVSGSPMSVEVMLSDGQVIAESTSDMDAILSERLGRKVRLTSVPPAHPVLEQYSPNLDSLPDRDAERTVKIFPATFFDEAPVHLLTTSTLQSLQVRYPNGHFDTRRFRPNMVVDTGTSGPVFLENDWKGRIVAIGAQVRVAITSLCARCVMTTLPQQGLPRDLAILRAVVQHNSGMAGVLASVVMPGVVYAGDAVSLEE